MSKQLVVPTRAEVVEITRGAMGQYDQPVRLKSGALSRKYADVKFALSFGPNEYRIGLYALALLDEAGVDFNVVGGLTMGADVLTFPIAHKRDLRYFQVCKEGELYGRYSADEPLEIVGTRFLPGDRILITEDVTTTGGSAESAIDAIKRVLAAKKIDDVEIVGVCTVLDRGHEARARFTKQGMAFVALTTYEDMDIEPLN